MNRLPAAEDTKRKNEAVAACLRSPISIIKSGNLRLQIRSGPWACHSKLKLCCTNECDWFLEGPETFYADMNPGTPRFRLLVTGAGGLPTSISRSKQIALVLTGRYKLPKLVLSFSYERIGHAALCVKAPHATYVRDPQSRSATAIAGGRSDCASSCDQHRLTSAFISMATVS
jgi:hypothetical protein